MIGNLLRNKKIKLLKTKFLYFLNDWHSIFLHSLFISVRRWTIIYDFVLINANMREYKLLLLTILDKIIYKLLQWSSDYTSYMYHTSSTLND